jgi:hypothetical protein
MGTPEALDVADKVPHAVPLQPTPFNVQLTPLFCESFCTVAVILWVWLVCTEAAVGFTATTIPAAGAAFGIVIVATAVFELSATEVAVTVTDAGEGTFAGAA